MVDFDPPVWRDMPVLGLATSVRRFLLAISYFFSSLLAPPSTEATLATHPQV